MGARPDRPSSSRMEARVSGSAREPLTAPEKRPCEVALSDRSSA